MRLRPTIALAVVLSFAAILPPSLRMAMVGHALGQAHATGSHLGAKTTPPRGRNRIPSTPRVIIADVNSRVGAGKPGLAPRLRFASERQTRDLRNPLDVSPPPSPITPASHLRC